MTDKKRVYIYGKNVLTEALEHTPQAVLKIFLDPKIKDVYLLELIRKTKVPCTTLKGNGGGHISKDAVHQGVIGILDTSALLISFSTFIDTLDMSSQPALVILGEVQDPHNVGAIIRSAAAFGISGVLIPKRNQAGITGAVVKTSAGMVFRVPLISIGNVNQTMHTLKNHGFWSYALSMDGNHTLETEKFNAPTLFVMGNEGSGVRQKTLELCDIKLSIPMHKRCESLNVAAAAAVVFHTWSIEHPDALGVTLK